MVALLLSTLFAIPNSYLVPLDPGSTPKVQITLLVDNGGPKPDRATALGRPSLWGRVFDGPEYKGYYFTVDIAHAGAPGARFHMGCFVPAPALPDWTTKGRHFVMASEPERDENGRWDMMCREIRDLHVS